jgi:uncharacterized repeat protein (TIGR01451 family)
MSIAMCTRFTGNSLVKAGFCVSLVLVLPWGLLAQGSTDVRVNLTAKRVVTSDGQESLVSAEKAKPGEVIQYEAVYKNGSNAPVKNVAATVPVPPGLAFVEGSTKPPAAEASLDGKIFAPVPLTREVKNEAGVLEKRPVPVAEYRALRWVINELPAGASATVLLRARVLTSAP